jgi:hypothetical protein
MTRDHPFWGPAIAICESTRSAHERGLADLRRREAAQRIEAFRAADQIGRQFDLKTED